jgi:uncharacterized glyoxalase superfamily protein PhnB
MYVRSERLRQVSCLFCLTAKYMPLTQLIPSIECADLGATIHFYRNMLGMEVVSFYPDDAMPYWAMLQRDGVQVMVTEQKGGGAPQFTAFTGSFYVYPDDVESLWVEVATRIDPALIEWPLEAFDYGMLEFAVRDPNGYLWRFGQELEALAQTRQEGPGNNGLL